MFFNSDILSPSLFTYSSIALAFFLFLYGLFLPKIFFQQLRRIQDRVVLTAWVLVSAYYYFIFYKVFPGWVGYDDCHAAEVILKGQAWGWQSLSYSFVLSTGYILLGKMGLVVLISLTYFNYLSLKIFQIIEENFKGKIKYLVVVIFVILCLHPTNQSLLLSHYRDILFSLMLIHVGLIVYYVDSWRSKDVFLFSLLVIILGDIRQDAKVYLLLIPIFLYIAKVWNLKNLKVYLLTIVLLGGAYYAGGSFIFNIKPYGNNYKVTAYVHPLSVIFKFNSLDKFSTEEIKNIDAVLSIEKLIKNYDPLDIVPFHEGAYKYNHTQSEWSRFQKTAHSLILKNVFLVAQSRNEIFWSAINYGRQGLIFFDHLRFEKEKTQSLIQVFKLSDEQLNLSSSANKYYRFLHYFNSQRGFWWGILNSLVVPLVFLCVCTSLFCLNGRLLFICMLVLSRLPVIYFLAPASYYKYIYSLLLFFIFVTPIFLVFIQKRMLIKKSRDGRV